MVDVNKSSAVLDHHFLKTRYHLTAQDVAAISQAVAEAESKTSGEIVPVIVGRSSPRQMPRKLAFLILLFACALYYHFVSAGWHTDQIWLTCGLALLCITIVSYFLPEFLERLLWSKADLNHICDLRAEVEFFEADLRQTEARSGILLFISMFEHRAVVLADIGISEKLPPTTWHEVVDLMIRGAKTKKTAVGLCEAIKTCGDILAEHFPKKEFDRDELPNSLVLK
jgi:putative membrane protein